MRELVRELQKAHSGEIAAYRAYGGHRKSVSDIMERQAIADIQLAEKKHRHNVEYFLEQLGAKPDRFRDFVFKIIGSVVSAMCHVSSRMAIMYGAAFMERVGASSYLKMSLMASEAGHKRMSGRLLKMHSEETAHEDYFLKLSRSFHEHTDKNDRPGRGSSVL